MSKATFTISRASLSDVPRIGEISTRAFDNDSHSQMKIMGQKPGAFAEGMAIGARGWIESPRAVLLKATDDRDGTIVGSMAWGFRGVELDASPGEDKKATEQVEETVVDDDGKGEGATETEEPIPGAERINELEAMTSKHLHDFMHRIMPDGSKCIFMGGITVDPKYQGQGVGSQLIRWGTEQADRLGAFSWVHASEAGWPVFAKHGFKEVERLTFDMDTWAVGPPPKDGVFGDRESWGPYTFRYMVRQPIVA
ncbi:acyl-CoA N-acyltransferase [Ilyonectria sp. MPI-CAGE-AT-0026]|nr:acyl-CoA N-acyltransferase [Ilyonectria sp. MPI-CAGE-AT-0026]